MRSTHLLLTALLSIFVFPLFSQGNFWSVLDEENLSNRTNERWIIPSKYEVFSLDFDGMTAFLSDVPLRFNENQASKTVQLPMPDGSFEDFAIVEAPIMHPRLASKFPTIKTFSGQGIGDPSSAVYLDITPKGFHGMIMKRGEVFFIDTYYSNDRTAYIVYDKSDFSRQNIELLVCGEDDFKSTLATEHNAVGSGERMTTVTLRTYEIAVAATVEYTQFHGGTVASALAAIVTAVNRVRGIYETELAISFQLVANNDLIVYTGTDPYSSPPTLDENQANLDVVIGNANYDIGHVLSIGTGGIARLESACDDNNKARGMTSLDTPAGDPFYVDFFAHELGHQMGAHHSYNGNAGECGSSGTFPNAAFEPGSGSTIMGYAGICGTQNVQFNSHAYFHRISLDEITAYMTTGDGNTCATATNSGNEPPTINANPLNMSGKTIPISTPFELTASGADPDNDVITYVWEQMDLGPAGAPSPSAAGPILRSYSPSTSAMRTFPSLSAILDNTSYPGEFLPSVTRTLNFTATARDNKSVGGGNASGTLTLNVTSDAGPFRIINMNASERVNGSRTIYWDEANTSDAPVNCANVDIMLSLNGGQTFSTLVSNTPNDGNETITFPNTPTGQARIKVKCSNNVFFDINDADLRIAPSDATCSEKIIAGNMDTYVGWTELSTHNNALIDYWDTYHNEIGSAWLGYDDNETSSISQEITIPAGVHFATLEFWYKLELFDCGNDVLRVKINGDIVKTYTLCNDPAAGGWVRQLIDLSAYANSSPTEIMFESINNSNSPSDVFIDDVSVYVCKDGAFAPLPIELMSFDARAKDHNALLNWATASEQNNLGFAIEMKTEFSDFQAVGFVAGKGTTTESNNYEFSIPGLTPGLYYFRLRQLDENGNFNYSPIRAVMITGNIHVTVQPNPAKDVAFFNISLADNSYIHLQVIDGLGRVVGTVVSEHFSAGDFELAFNLKELPEGIYYFRMIAEGMEETGRFVVTK